MSQDKPTCTCGDSRCLHNKPREWWLAAELAEAKKSLALEWTRINELKQALAAAEKERDELRAYLERDKTSTGAAQVIRLTEQLQAERERADKIRTYGNAEIKVLREERDGYRAPLKRIAHELDVAERGLQAKGIGNAALNEALKIVREALTERNVDPFKVEDRREGK